MVVLPNMLEKGKLLMDDSNGEFEVFPWRLNVQIEDLLGIRAMEHVFSRWKWG